MSNHTENNLQARTVKWVAILLSFLVVLFASGCPIMMPFMMGGLGGMGHGQTKGNDPLGKTLDALLLEAVQEAFDVHGPYETISLDQTEVRGSSIPTSAFREALLERLRSYRTWKVLDEPGGRADRPDAAPAPEGRAGSTAMISGELLQEGQDLRLVLRLADARTSRTYWSGSFSRSIQTPGNGGGETIH